MRRADLAVRALDARLPTPPGVDRALALLSDAADHGKLWFAAAAVLALTGRRRAALRGTLSLAAASAAANLVGKRLVGGQRPPPPALAARRSARRPTSGAFPSGHSASAAAFATGASLESPEAAVVLVPLAALVAFSRLHTGAHWFSDVVGGVTLGAVTALLGGVVVPVRRGVR